MKGDLGSYNNEENSVNGEHNNEPVQTLFESILHKDQPEMVFHQTYQDYQQQPTSLV
jgi:hypothetical protein